MNALDVLAAMSAAPDAPQALHEARAAVAELVGAATLVTGKHDMATVKGRFEMQRRLNILNAAIAKFEVQP